MDPLYLDDIAAKLHANLPTFHEEAHLDVLFAPRALVPAPPAPLAQPDEIAKAQALLRARFEEVKQNAPRGPGRPKSPIVCAACKTKFPKSDDKYNHARRWKCVPV